jgi:tetratricopeptide (TPR) repeat protein
LRRWYLEGYKTIKPDEARARELETQAKQGRPQSWGIETKNRATGATETVALYFREPVAGSDVVADELYRIARYLNLEPTEAGTKLISEIFRIASENKETVARILEQARTADNPVALDNTSVTGDLAKVASLVKEKQLTEAYQQVAVVRGGLMTRGAVVDANNLMAWAAVAESFSNVAALADELKDVQTSRKAAADAEEIMTSILGIEADGTSPRLNLAASLERVARRAYQNKRPETAKLFARANALRTTVRVQDPQNSECACQIASNFHSIASFEKGRGRLDEAVQAMLRALQISEELAALEPHQNWSRDVASRDLALATLFHERDELRLALMYARPAVSIRAAVAARHSATSDERKAYAEALEAQSLYAREWAKHFSLDREAERKDADQFFELGISSLLEANEIRESVLRADPADTSCRCQVGSNFGRVADAYRNWRKIPEQIKALDDAIRVQRAVQAKQPDNLAWQYNLGLSLKDRSGALATFSKVDYASVVANEEEAIQFLRKIVSAKDLDKKVILETQDTVRGLLTDLSFHSLFLTATDKTRAAKAMQAADEAIALGSNPLSPLTNKAHALMYLGREAEAIEVYRTNVGKALGNRTWEAAITDDFDRLTAHGLRHPTMDKVRPMLLPKVSKN